MAKTDRVRGLGTMSVERYGWVPDLPDTRDFVYAAPQEVLERLPERVDLRRGCPPVYDQGRLGSCTANAIGAAYAFIQESQHHTSFTPSRLFIYFNERAIRGTIPFDSGASLRDGIKSVSKVGVCPETMWPYKITRFRDKPATRCYTDAKKHQALVYRRVSQNLDQLQGCLASRTPIVFGFAVYDSFESAAVRRTGVVPMPRRNQRVLGGHAVLAVGYDDRNETFLVRNSWGPEWGKAGYFTMPYRYLTTPQLAQDFWAIEEVEKAFHASGRGAQAGNQA